MFVFAPLGLIGNLRRQLVAALDAWSYRVAMARAARRLRREAARKAAATPVSTPRWPSSWGH